MALLVLGFCYAFKIQDEDIFYCIKKSSDFNLKKSISSITPEGHISVDNYILGYDELYKFLNLLGTVFGWVASDVHAKLEVCSSH